MKLQKRFKRLKRAVEDSDGEEEEDPGMDRDVIANQLFDGDDVSLTLYDQHFSHKRKKQNHEKILILLLLISCIFKICFFKINLN